MLKGSLREFSKIVVITIFFLLLGTFVMAFTSYLLKEQQVANDEKKRLALYENILDGAATGRVNLSINYSNKISQGSPLIFGGSHSPLVEHQQVWNEIEKIGVTSVRKDFFPENSLPKNITLEDYKNNKNDIQNSNKWNQVEINKINDIYINAHKRNIKTIGIVSYSPAWLNYSNTIYGVPKDWEVYKDIVKKNYKLYRDNLDYIEIWNEPSFDFFLNLSNSNLSREQAYKMIFQTAVEGIREVDNEINDGKRIKIGGPVSHRPFDTSVLEVILKDPQLSKELDFISYHNYEAEHLIEPSDIYFKKVLKKYNKEYLPIFITEWNYHPDWNRPNEYNTSDVAITFTGRKFISYLQMGIEGANYHTLEPLNELQPNRGEGTYGFYRWNSGNYELLPQAKTWRLLSNKMSLGKGISQIYNVESDIKLNDTTMAGFKNINNQYGIIISNESKVSDMTEFKLTNTNIGKFTKVVVYFASKENDASTPVYEGLLKSQNGNINFKFQIPSETVVGISFTEQKDWFDNLPLSF